MKIKLVQIGNSNFFLVPKSLIEYFKIPLDNTYEIKVNNRGDITYKVIDSQTTLDKFNKVKGGSENE